MARMEGCQLAEARLLRTSDWTSRTGMTAFFAVAPFFAVISSIFSLTDVRKRQPLSIRG
jgi:hypothetical protein